MRKKKPRTLEALPEEMSSKVRKRKGGEGDEEDRISSLSDDLIHLILSFMDTKYAIQTCVLSKRWKSVWKSLPYLDFNHQTFPFNGDPTDGLLQRVVSFLKFIDQVLSKRHHTDLVKVCFQVQPPFCYLNTMGKVIAYAVDHNVQQLTIQSNVSWYFMLPECFYTCKSLIALQVLDGRGDTIKFLKFMALPALKSLHIHGCSVSKESFNFDDFSGFPNLETLELIDIRYEEDNTLLYVTAPPNLKKLELSFSKDYERNGCKVAIRAPTLMTFKYSSYASMIVYLLDDDFASLHDAYIDIHDWCIWASKASDNEENCDKFSKHVVNWVNNLKKFRHAESLTLSWETVAVLSMIPLFSDKNRLPFSNLKYLKMKLEQWQSCNIDKDVEMFGRVLNFFFKSSTRLKVFG